MTSYVVLLRGINVGGKNKIPMAALKQCLQAEGYQEVGTYIQSGNVLLRSDLDAATIGRRIEAALQQNFTLDSDIVRVLVLTHAQLQKIIDEKPAGFGEHPETYHSDVIFFDGYRFGRGDAGV